MEHLPTFISDLAIILITASIVTIIFKWLKQPVVLGYIVAGFLASSHLRNIISKVIGEVITDPNSIILPYLNVLPQVSDVTNVKVWAEIGVIFLLFALGLEFSFKKLLEVGRTAFIATFINSSMMIIVGYTVGRLLGWSGMDSIFLGSMVAMSSTIIIIKAFTDLGLQKKKFAGVVFGMLIVEDMGAVLLMVLLSTLAISKNFEGGEFGYSMVKLAFFMLIWFVVGIYLIPTILKKLKKYLNDETLLIVSIGLCLSMVLFATNVGFSAALGAFIMGSILAETIESKHIEQLLEPIKNLFGAIFFVSVGMMIDPMVIIHNFPIVLLLVVVVVVGRTTFATIGVLASGQGLKVALQSGFSLAQVGEFSFIIATLGLSFGVISEMLYPIIVAVSVITTFTTPYSMKLPEPVFKCLEKRIPDKWSVIIQGYAAASNKNLAKDNDWRRLIRSMASLVGIYSAICVAIILIVKIYIMPMVVNDLTGIWTNILAGATTIILMAPFMRAIMMKKNRSVEFRNLWSNSSFNKWVLSIIVAGRILICILFISVILIPLFPQVSPISLILVALIIAIVIIFSKNFKNISRLMEGHFFDNLNRKQVMSENRAVITSRVAKQLLSKDIHIEEIEISQCSPVIGKTLRELNFRQRTGVNIIAIIRGSIKNNIPDSTDVLYPFDKIVVAGSDEQIQKLIQSIEEQKSERATAINEDTQYHIELLYYHLDEDSPMEGKPIKELKIRERTECMIIGIMRNDQSITSFTPDMVLEVNDILLLAGENEKLASFEESMNNSMNI